LCWLVVAHLLCFEKATLQALAGHTSPRVAISANLKMLNFGMLIAEVKRRWRIWNGMNGR
jgi:hypothetical protein